MAHSHYVMDIYFDGARREVLRITATDDTGAIREASRISGWRQPVRYEVRAITMAARAAHRIVYASVIAERAPEDNGPLKARSPSDGGIEDVDACIAGGQPDVSTPLRHVSASSGGSTAQGENVHRLGGDGFAVTPPALGKGRELGI